MSDVKIKELDKSLIHQANSNSMGGQRGVEDGRKFDPSNKLKEKKQEA